MSSGSPRTSSGTARAPNTNATGSVLQAAGDEGQHLRRLAVEPLRVVDDTEDRPLRRQLRHQAQPGQADQQPIRGRAGHEPEGDPQSVPLRLRQRVQPDQAGGAELVEGRERKLPLGLVAHRPQHLEPLGRADGVLQQRRLANARLTVDHECSAVAAARPDQQSVEHLALACPPEQHRPQIASSPGSLANRPRDCGFPGCAPPGAAIAFSLATGASFAGRTRC